MDDSGLKYTETGEGSDSLVPRFHCPACFFCSWKNMGNWFFQSAKNAGQCFSKVVSGFVYQMKWAESKLPVGLTLNNSHYCCLQSQTFLKLGNHPKQIPKSPRRLPKYITSTTSSIVITQVHQSEDLHKT